MRMHLRAVMWMAAFLAVCLPALATGDTVAISDGSLIKGKVVRLEGDTLTVESSFGGLLNIPRARVLWISFGDSVVVPMAKGAVGGTGAPETKAATRPGDLQIEFKDRGLSSKIIVTRKKDREGHLRANHIEQRLVVDGETAFVWMDSVMDKTIYNGPDRIYKNSIELKDVSVKLPPGPHHVKLVVRNVGAESYKERFDHEPLEIEFTIGDVQVYEGRPTSVRVGISRGTLRLGKPKLYLAD